MIPSNPILSNITSANAIYRHFYLVIVSLVPQASKTAAFPRYSFPKTRPKTPEYDVKMNKSNQSIESLYSPARLA